MDQDEERLLYRVAKLYYEADYTQGKIAKDLGIHRTTIGRMLKKAQKNGIVKIEIQSKLSEYFELEKQITDYFGMKEVIIVPSASDQTTFNQEHAISQASYRLLDRVIQDADVVGLNWGTTLGNVFNQQVDVKPKQVDCVPLVGGPGEMNVDFHVNAIAFRFAQAFNATPHLIDAAAVYKSKETAEEVMDSVFMDRIRELWKTLTIAVVGIGAPESSSNMVWSGFLGEIDQKELVKHDAAGEICSRFFTPEGEVIKSPISDRTIAIELENLKKLRYSIGIAYSKEKAKSIIAAMKGNLINTLVTTEDTATEINRLMKNQ